LAPALFAIALGHAGAVHADPVPMKPVDPQRYAGRWYEVARLPNKIQADCAAATSDWSRQSDGGFDVVQTCHNGSEEKSWRGSGRITDASTNSKFRIGFFGGLIQKDYWIVDRADDYSWCMLTTPNSKFLWIMSRRPGMTEAQKAALVAHARTLGFDVSKLVYDAQPSA
jgi:apolipoprotein D and lipocalin family protein